MNTSITGALIVGILGVEYAMSRLVNLVSRAWESANRSPFTTALVILVLAETALIVHFLNTTSEDAANSTAVQAGATIVLVLITIWYADHTRRSANLFRRELELETQRNHANTLQIRTQKWLDNFPEVQETDIPAFSDADINGSFAVPTPLQGDPYFEDLIENHATDLEDHVEAIESKYMEFREIRDDFVDSIDFDPIIPESRLFEVLEDIYALWMFEQVLLLERTEKDKDDLEWAVEKDFMNESYEGEDMICYITGNIAQERRKPIAVYHYLRSASNNRRDDFWNRYWASIPKHHIRDIESLPEYNKAVRASKLLDELQQETKQLEKKLIQYNEVPRFEGECNLMLDIET